MIQFGMPTLIENRILEDNVSLCSSLGLRFIELNMNFPEYQVDKLEQTSGLLKKHKFIIQSIWTRILISQISMLWCRKHIWKR